MTPILEKLLFFSFSPFFSFIFNWYETIKIPPNFQLGENPFWYISKGIFRAVWESLKKQISLSFPPPASTVG